jgi:hypothetical protein
MRKEDNCTVANGLVTDNRNDVFNGHSLNGLCSLIWMNFNTKNQIIIIT